MRDSIVKGLLVGWLLLALALPVLSRYRVARRTLAEDYNHGEGVVCTDTLTGDLVGYWNLDEVRPGQPSPRPCSNCEATR